MPPSGAPEPPAAGRPGAELEPLLDAAFAELDGAIDALTTLQAQAARRTDAPSEQTRAERRMLRAVFQEAPLALFLLERDGTARGINTQASGISASGPAYAAVKPFTVFVDLPSRATIQTNLAAAARTGRARQTRVGLLAEDGVIQVRLTVEPIALPEDSGVLLVAATPDVPATASAAPANTPAVPASPGVSAKVLAVPAAQPTPAAPATAKDPASTHKAPATVAPARPAPRPGPPRRGGAPAQAAQPAPEPAPAA